MFDQDQVYILGFCLLRMWDAIWMFSRHFFGETMSSAYTEVVYLVIKLMFNFLPKPKLHVRSSSAVKQPLPAS